MPVVLAVVAETTLLLAEQAQQGRGMPVDREVLASVTRDVVAVAVVLVKLAQLGLLVDTVGMVS